MTTWLSDRALEHLRDVAARPDPESPRYTLVDEIGRGGMGVVYRARDEMLERDVAVKVIGGSLGGARFGGATRREAHVLASLEHPGIVPVHDAGRCPTGGRSMS